MGIEAGAPEHFAAPFEIVRAGAKVVEQNSPEDILDCVLRVCQCQEGFREDVPQFGIPGPEFEQIPLALEPIEAAIERWEPEATVEMIERAFERIQSEREILVEVEP